MKSIFFAFLASLMIASPIGSVALAETDTHERATASNNFSGSSVYSRRRYRSDKSPIPRKEIAFKEGYPAGTIIIDTSDRRLYHVLGNGKAMRYGVGVGREGFEWSGTNRVSRKAEWPSWTPPEVMIKREAAKGRILPRYMEGGPNNPMGARALYIGSTIYRIHGTNEPWSIGQAMSSGCIRMANDDVRHLYERVSVGNRVIVRH